MDSLTLVVPGRIDARTGGYEYDRRLTAALADRGWCTTVVELHESFPRPTDAALRFAADALARLTADSLVVVDGLALGAMPTIIEREASRLRVVALLHHPLAAETGLDPTEQAALWASERRALAATRRVIVTSRATAAALEAYEVPDHRITVVEPGTDPASLARGSGDGTIALVSVGAVIPRKGFDVLIEALAGLARLDWRLTVVGSLERDPRTASAVRAQVCAARLESRVSFAGEAGERDLAKHYDRADVFVLSTRYEGFGMAVAEALARGLPVVSTPTGGIESLLAGGAGLLVPPGDTYALSIALGRVIGDSTLRQRLAAGARETRGNLPGWEVAAARAAAVLAKV